MTNTNRHLASCCCDPCIDADLAARDTARRDARRLAYENPTYSRLSPRPNAF